MQPNIYPAVRPPIKLLRPPAVLELYGSKKSQLYADIADGVMTEAIRQSHKVAFWPEHEIAAINAARIAGWTSEQMRGLVQRLYEKRKTDAAALQAGA